MKRFSLLIIALLSFSFCFSQKTKVEIKRTDMMKGDKEVRKLYGNVLFQHNDAYMYCDSAISYAKDNRFEAYGHAGVPNNQTGGC